jgi:asparagine synthase (glutamine-hydrolysing)
MCGILGVVGRAAQHVTSSDFSEICMSLKARGPDDKGQWKEAGVVLGQTRLSILDLSAQAHQPMVSEDGRYVLCYNGEIYNFQAIRDELKETGCFFGQQVIQKFC